MCSPTRTFASATPLEKNLYSTSARSCVRVNPPQKTSRVNESNMTNQMYFKVFNPHFSGTKPDATCIFPGMTALAMAVPGLGNDGKLVAVCPRLP